MPLTRDREPVEVLTNPCSAQYGSVKAKAWEGSINVYESNNKFYWDILCDRAAFDVSGRKGHKTEGAARTAARRATKRLGLVEKAKAGKVT